MSFHRYRLGILVAVLTVSLVMLEAPAAQADIGQSILNVTEPLEVPGKVLEPGTYLVRVIRTQGRRDVVEVLSPDMQRIYATVLTLMVDNGKPATENQFVFIPTGERQTPRALRTWTFIGSQYGHEFIYGSDRVAAFERASKIKPMITMTQELEQELAEATPVQPAGSQVAANSSTAGGSQAGATSAGETSPSYGGTMMAGQQPPMGATSEAPVQMASASQPKSGATRQAGSKQMPKGEGVLPNVLPRTADSTTPLLAMAGLALVLGGFGLRRLVSRTHS